MHCLAVVRGTMLVKQRLHYTVMPRHTLHETRKPLRCIYIYIPQMFNLPQKLALLLSPRIEAIWKEMKALLKLHYHNDLCGWLMILNHHKRRGFENCIFLYKLHPCPILITLYIQYTARLVCIGICGEIYWNENWLPYSKQNIIFCSFFSENFCFLQTWNTGCTSGFCFGDYFVISTLTARYEVSLSLMHTFSKCSF